MSLPGAGSPTQQIPGEFSADVALLQGQAQLAQALHNYIDIQNRVRQEEAITAAAQLLDPMAKLRLLRALQGQSLNGGLNGPDGVDPALLAALSGLSMGGPNGGVAAPARHSIDNSYVASGPTLGAFAAASAITGPGRRSIDIGSLSRTAVDSFTTANAISSAAELQGFSSPDSAGSSAAASLSIGGGLTPSLNGATGPSPQIYGSVPSASFMDYPAGMSFYRSSATPTENGVPSGSSSDGAEHPAAVPAGLHSIDELGPVGDDESSSSTSVVARSISAGSSLDASGKEGGPSSQRSVFGMNGVSANQVPRVMSFDNILAELPRSASQVNMVELGIGGYT